MSEMNDLFNNREIATGIWLAVAIFFGAKHKSVRESCRRILESFWRWKIVVPVLLMGLHVGLSVLFLHWLRLWNISLLKDAIYWFLFSGFVLFMNLMTGDDCAAFFRKTIIGCFKIIVFLQFLLNFYTLTLLVELLLVPVLVFVGAVSAYAESKPEYAVAKKFFDFVLAVIGFAVAAFVARSVYLHYSGLLKIEVLLGVLLPIRLTLLFLPFLYVAKLISDYEMLFIRLPYFVKRDEKLVAYVKRRILLLCHVDLKKLNTFSKEKLTRLYSIESKEGADQIFKAFRLGAACSAEERE